MSNQLMQGKWAWVEGTHPLRDGILDILTDADLSFTPGGTAMTFGALIREMGEVEYAYIQSIKTFKQDWSYRHADKSVEGSVEKLKGWFKSLDADFKAAVEALSDEDIANKIIDRGGFNPNVELQLDIYLQALLIFFGKATIYLRAMNKPLPENLEQWIG